MRIGIDARYIQDYFPGIGRYTFNLARALSKVSPEDTFCVYYDPGLTNTRFDLSLLEAANVILREIRVPTFSLPEQWKLPSILRSEELDVFHSPYYLKPYVTPCPSVVTIHDASGARFPQYLPSTRISLLLRAATKLASMTSRLVITDSMASRSDLATYFGIPKAKIRVVYPAANQFDVKSLDSTGDHSALREGMPIVPFILFVGIDKPHKNLVTLVRALAKSEIRHKLLIVGRNDERHQQTRKEVESLGLQERVTFLGEVDDLALSRLYRSADFFAFPSLCEGFGLPVLEAMEFGLPVISSNSSSLPEVVGDAGVLIDPLDTEEWASDCACLQGGRSFETSMGGKARRGRPHLPGNELQGRLLLFTGRLVGNSNENLARLQGLLPVIGGIENHIRVLCKGLREQYRDFDISVLVTNTGLHTKTEIIDGVEVVKAGRIATFASTPISLSLFTEMRKRDYDIVHLHFPYPMSEMAYLLSGRAKHLVITYHSDIVKQKNLLRLYLPFLWRILKRADVITLSNPNYATSSPYLRHFLDKCVTIPHGVDVSRFESSERDSGRGIRHPCKIRLPPYPFCWSATLLQGS